jgi:20S proteasome alpha/beta subunit
MSLGLVIKAPEGVVLAAESRVTLSATIEGQQVPVFFDNATKMFGFEAPNNFVGVVTYGLAAIKERTAHSFLPELEAALKHENAGRLSVHAMSQRLSDFYTGQWAAAGMPQPYQGPSMTFLIAGFDDNEPYGRIYQINLPASPAPVELNPGDFGITWGGQREFVDRLIQGYDAKLWEILKAEGGLDDNDVATLKGACGELQMQLPLNAMALQDCVDLGLFFIRTTIAAQELTVGVRGCGGHIDVATVTRREGLRYVQKKSIQGESGRS